ncbi:MAG: Uncharacterised protein [Cryomorphaceae bacterium]|nr:MAG: Uncharacterised protein [Cryomorphaceae bacterium]
MECVSRAATSSLPRRSRHAIRLPCGAPLANSWSKRLRPSRTPCRSLVQGLPLLYQKASVSPPVQKSLPDSSGTLLAILQIPSELGNIRLCNALRARLHDRRARVFRLPFWPILYIPALSQSGPCSQSRPSEPHRSKDLQPSVLSLVPRRLF